MSFRSKILLYILVACLVCTGAAVYMGVGVLEHDLEKGLTDKSSAILSRLESARRYVATQGLLEETIKDTVKKFPNGDLPEEQKQKILNVVPIYASLKIGSDEANKDNYKFRVAVKEPRRQENLATAKESEFIEQFESDPNLKELTYNDKETGTFWVMRPVRISKADGCLNCHGHPSTSPYGNGKDILGYKMENWSDGKLHGIFKIMSSTAPVKAEVKSATTKMLLWAGGILIFALAIVVVLLKKPIDMLNRIAAKMSEIAVSGLKSSESLGAASQTVSASTTEQAAAVQETMSSMSEMTAMIAKTQELASQTQELATELDQKSKSGTGVMHGMVESMDSIKKSNEDLKMMVQIINDISVKTNVINDIVFKTQLLSVNASIEAARAGQHGKGFAVVAEEVGNLAQISGKAAEEIRDMLSKSQTHVQDVVNVTSERVAEGEKVSQNAMKSFEEISKGINKIQEYSLSVSEATNQQKEGITQISVAMNQMDQASQQNSEMASEVSEMSNDMLTQSRGLEGLSKETQVLVYGTVHEIAVDTHDKKSKPKTVNKAVIQKPASAMGGRSLAHLKTKILSSQNKKAEASPTAKFANGSNGIHADSDDFGSKSA
jgi:methyl-accepting chemotaxis protein